MRLRNIATIYVFNGDCILLMYRIGSSLFTENIWVGIGGHFESEEMNNPQKCVLRELQEETGLNSDDIKNITLKYITTRKTNNEIRQQYIFTADLNKELSLTDFRSIDDEGTLSWIPLNKLFDRKMAYSNTECLKHYFRIGKNDDSIYSVAVGSDENELYANITALKEYGNDK